ncbi:acetoacetate decarboxylase family protein [Nocardioides humi]|nr:acetoacetate decarboxylase family protein [Nocardioides humi]
MPVGFGPSVGPRQGPDGTRFNGEWARTATAHVSYRTEADALASVLPPGFAPAADPIVRVQTLQNTDFAWLAGRGYNWTEVLFSATYHSEKGPVSGDFVAVMWESKADPIIPGREELGLPKLFADVPDVRSVNGRSFSTASWDGFQFMEMTLEDLVVGPWPTEKEADAVTTSLGLGGSEGRPRLYYKYMPRTGDWANPDVAYVTVAPASNYEVKVLESWTGDGVVAFNRARWEDLPTFCNIVNAIADLPVLEFTGAGFSRALVAFNDLADSQHILP